MADEEFVADDEETLGGYTAGFGFVPSRGLPYSGYGEDMVGYLGGKKYRKNRDGRGGKKNPLLPRLW
jgi:hypothetical protein